MRNYFILLSFLFCAVVADAQFPQSSKVKKDVEQPALSKLLSNATKLNDEQVAELYSIYTDADKALMYTFVMNFERQTLNSKHDAKKIEKYAKSGEVPCRLTASLYETKEVSGKKVSKRMSGTLKFYIVDSNGKMVVQKSSSLSSMCPS